MMRASEYSSIARYTTPRSWRASSCPVPGSTSDAAGHTQDGARRGGAGGGGAGAGGAPESGTWPTAAHHHDTRAGATSRARVTPRTSEHHAEGEKGRILGDQVRAREESTRQVHADRAGRHAHADARPGEPVPDERVSAPQPAQPRVADGDAHAHLRVPIAPPRAVHVRGDLEIEPLRVGQPAGAGAQNPTGRARNEASRPRDGLAALVH